MAENTTKNEANNNEKETKSRKKLGNLMGFIKKHRLIALFVIAIIAFCIFAALYKHKIKEDARENPDDPKNGPAAANEFINNTYIDEDGNLKFEKSIRELWNEMKQKGNMLTKYLDSPEQLAKLLSASVATDFPDTRRADVNGETPDDPIDWSKYDLNIDSTDVQGIVKFKRALSSGDTITMTYLSPSEFQKKMNKYNRTGKKEDRDEALKYFTIERTLGDSNSNSSGAVDVGSRDYNNDTFNVENIVDVVNLTGDLGNGKTYEAVQSCCFDGKYIICGMNKRDNSGGKIIWINYETKKIEHSLIVGSEFGHMEGLTYDSARKILLYPKGGSSQLIQINNETKQKMSEEVKVPQHFRQLAFSVTTQRLIGYNDSKKTLTFMRFDGTQYVEDGKVNLSFKDFTNVQGISSDGQVVYISDSIEGATAKVYAFDFQGNKVEEHLMGDGFTRNSKEVENCFVDKNGNLILCMPHMIAKVKNYKGHPVDWENNYSEIPSSTGGSSEQGSFSQLEEILQYACSWVGKVGYEKGSSQELVKGGKSDCSNFIHKVYSHFGLMKKSHKDGFVNSYKWGKGENGGCPGTENIGKDISKAAPGDIIFEHYHDKSAHVSIYLGKGKRLECTAYKDKGVTISKVPSNFTAIVKFKTLARDTNAYFDPDTGELHTSKSNTTTSNTSSSTKTTSSSSTTTSTKSRTTSSTSSSSSGPSGQDIVNEAEKYVGKLPYVPGGKSLQTGADCSGFCWAILRKLGLYKGGYINTDGFLNAGTKVADLAAARAGDMIIFGPENGKTTHMGIYDGKGGLIHEPDVGQKAKHANSLSGMGNIRAIRRFTNNSSSSSTSTLGTLGPVNTDEIYGQFSEDTRQRILDHCNDFNVHNYKDFIKNYPGGYDGYVQSLGGVFEKYGGKGKDVKVTDAGTFQEVAEYTWGLFAIWGFDYWNGKTFHSWGKDNSGVASSAYYPSHKKEEHYSTGHIDDICSNPSKAMRTNCNCGSNAFLQKCGLTDDKNFTTYWKRGQLIENPDDLQIGDLVHFFHSEKISGESWGHVAVVGEIDPELGPILYDTGNRFIRTGNYKYALKSNKYNNYKRWIGRRYFDIDQSTAGMIGAGTNLNSSTKYVYKVKVATWQESIEKVESETNPEENSSERNFSMNPITIPYQNIVSQYRMPFNYLWAMLLISQDKNYTFDLADLVRNSKIEITIHDNYNETTTKTTEERRTNWFYKGQANAQFEYAYNLEIPGSPVPTSSEWKTKTLPDLFKATAEAHKDYKKTTTITNKTNTLDVALTLADAWCVKYEKEYRFNGQDGPYSTTEVQNLADEEGDSGESSSITNSTLKNKIINSATSAANAWMNEQALPGTIKQPTIIHNNNEKEEVECTITNQKITTTTTTTTSSYTGETGKFTEDTPGRERFVDVFNRNTKARGNILSVYDWLFEILESNADTVNMVDLTKYLMYRATGTDYGVITFEFKEYNQSDFNDVGGDSSSIFGNNFEEKVWFALTEKYSEIAAAGAMGNFAKESGFKANNLQNEYETSLGYTDESYTRAVNNGSYSRESFIYDEAGYGLAQWTFRTRKAALYDFAKEQGTGIDNEETQIKFLLKEIKTHCTKWQKSTTVSEAAVNFHNEFEGSNDNESQIQNRVRAAEEYYNKYKGKKKPTTYGGFPRYYQSDTRWSSKRYGSDTIGEAGCGACALAMAVSGLTGRTIEPPEIVDYLNSKGISTAYEAEGTNSARAIAQKYGLSIEVVNKGNKAKIDAALDQGKVCMFSVSSNGVYSGAGHYILCYKRDSKGYYIVESAKFYDSNKPYSYEKTMGSSNNNGMVNILGK